MKIYKIERTDKWSYDDYDSAVVAAESEDDARSIHPDVEYEVLCAREQLENGRQNGDVHGWTLREYIKVTYLGEADSSIGRGVICASFNAE